MRDALAGLGLTGCNSRAPTHASRCQCGESVTRMRHPDLRSRTWLAASRHLSPPPIFSPKSPLQIFLIFAHRPAFAGSCYKAVFGGGTLQEGARPFSSR